MTDKPLILVADDETRIRRLVVESLENAGFDVCQAQDGRQAVDVFRLSPVEPDLVILDLMMPEMDGVEATKEIRGMDDRYYKNVPIIALTANAVNGVRDMYIEAGFDDFIAKPIELSALDRVLKMWLPKELMTVPTGIYAKDQ